MVHIFLFNYFWVFIFFYDKISILTTTAIILLLQKVRVQSMYDDRVAAFLSHRQKHDASMEVCLCVCVYESSMFLIFSILKLLHNFSITVEKRERKKLTFISCKHTFLLQFLFFNFYFLFFFNYFI